MSILENHANPVASVILWRKRVVPWFDFSVQPGGYPLRNLTTEHTEVAQEDHYSQRSLPHASINQAACCFTRKLFHRFCTDEATGSHQRTNALRRRVCTSRHAMALGISARHQRIPAEDDAR